MIVSKKGKLQKRIKKDINGKQIYRPNDCFADKEGGVYFSAPGDFDKQVQPMGRLYYLSVTGDVKELASGLTYPNGVAIFKEQLYVSEHLSERILKFRIDGPGQLSKKKQFIDTTSAPPLRKSVPDFTGPDGIEISKDGTFYIAEYGAGRILIYSLEGGYQKSIHTHPQFVTNLVLDEKENMLIVTGANELGSFLQKGVVYWYKLNNPKERNPQTK